MGTVNLPTPGQRIEELEVKVIAQQARIEQLKEQLAIAGHNCADDFIAIGCLESADSLDDLSALRAHDETVVKKAGEIMRERMFEKIDKQHTWITAVAVHLLIRALPIVTLDDLKGER